MSDVDVSQIESAVDRLVGGDPSARKELIQITCDRLTRLTRKMLKDFPTVRRWEETDDVFQRAAMRLWKSLEEVQPTSARHFLNLAALQIRRELIELSRSLQGPHGHARNHDSVANGVDETQSNAPLDAASDTYEAKRLASWSEFHQCVQNLEDDERETFELIWYQGLSQENVAQLLKVSQKTVSRRWQKARRNIYELLGKELP